MKNHGNHKFWCSGGGFLIPSPGRYRLNVLLMLFEGLLPLGVELKKVVGYFGLSAATRLGQNR
jgi:hypothetical protein